MKKNRCATYTQDVSRGFTSVWRRACLSEAAGCLSAKPPLYHFNGPIGYDSDNRNIVHVLDTHEKFCRRPSSLAHTRQWIATTGEHFRRTTWTFSLCDAVRAVAYLTSDYLNDRQRGNLRDVRVKILITQCIRDSRFSSFFSSIFLSSTKLRIFSRTMLKICQERKKNLAKIVLFPLRLLTWRAFFWACILLPFPPRFSYLQSFDEGVTCES